MEQLKDNSSRLHLTKLQLTVLESWRSMKINWKSWRTSWKKLQSSQRDNACSWATEEKVLSGILSKCRNETSKKKCKGKLAQLSFEKEEEDAIKECKNSCCFTSRRSIFKFVLFRGRWKGINKRENHCIPCNIDKSTNVNTKKTLKVSSRKGDLSWRGCWYCSEHHIDSPDKKVQGKKLPQKEKEEVRKKARTTVFIWRPERERKGMNGRRKWAGQR